MPPVKPYSSRSRSKIRFAVCCCFFGRDLSSKRMPSITRINGSSFGLAGGFLRTNPAVPKTSPSWRLSEDQSQIVVPPRDGLAPQFEPHSEPVHIAPRPSSPALCQSNAKGYLLPDFYSGCATGIPGRFSEGLLLRRVHP